MGSCHFSSLIFLFLFQISLFVIRNSVIFIFLYYWRSALAFPFFFLYITIIVSTDTSHSLRGTCTVYSLSLERKDVLFFIIACFSCYLDKGIKACNELFYIYGVTHCLFLGEGGNILLMFFLWKIEKGREFLTATFWVFQFPPLSILMSQSS